MSLTIRFLGATGTVTGSKYLIEHDGRKILIDCGLFQGVKELRLRNRAPLPVDPREIDAVVLTHAHLDHTGYLPVLAKEGFTGRIYCTPPTRDLSKIILVDAAKLEEEDAEYANHAGYTKHSPAKPLFTVEDAQRAMQLFRPVHGSGWTDLEIGAAGAFRIRFTPSGHILGSAFIELEAGGKRVVFSGDLGRADPILLQPPRVIESADYLLIESTYGDRFHPRLSPLNELERVTNETLGRGGQLLIPSFAVGRTQDLLYLFSELKARSRIPDVPIFLDSPLGINATEIFAEYPEWHRLLPDQLAGLRRTATMVRSQQQSREILHQKRPSVVIAGSGMLSGGRILHHVEARGSDARNTILLVGFQAAGTRGRLLKEGIPELKLHGQYIPVRARIEEISGLSAHADQGEALHWLRQFKTPPKNTFIVHGEPQASDALRVRIHDALGWKATIPAYLSRVELG